MPLHANGDTYLAMRGNDPNANLAAEVNANLMATEAHESKIDDSNCTIVRSHHITRFSDLIAGQSVLYV